LPTGSTRSSERAQCQKRRRSIWSRHQLRLDTTQQGDPERRPVLGFEPARAQRGDTPDPGLRAGDRRANAVPLATRVTKTTSAESPKTITEHREFPAEWPRLLAQLAAIMRFVYVETNA
jgi:hypothetical protein